MQPLGKLRGVDLLGARSWARDSADTVNSQKFGFNILENVLVIFWANVQVNSFTI